MPSGILKNISVQRYPRHGWLVDLNFHETWIFFVICDLTILHDTWYSLFYHSVLLDFETRFLRIVIVIYREGICNMEPWVSFSRFFFLQTLFLVQDNVIKKSISLVCFHCWFRKMKFLHPWSVIFPFVKRARDHLWDLLFTHQLRKLEISIPKLLTIDKLQTSKYNPEIFHI